MQYIKTYFVLYKGYAIMKKCLFINFNCAFNTHYETELELMYKYRLDGNDVYSLFCAAELNKNCAVAANNSDAMLCEYCQAKYYKGVELIGLSIEKCFTLGGMITYPDFVDIKYTSFQDLSRVEYLGVNIGDSIVRTYKNLKSMQTDDVTEMPDEYIRLSLINSINVLNKFIELHNLIGFDQVYFFSGRFPEYHPVLTYCRDNAISFYVHDRGANFNKYIYFKNSLLNDLNVKKDIYINSALKRDVSSAEMFEIGRKWFEAKINGSGGGWISFVEGQEAAKLPVGFDKSRYNIVIFNSSFHEACIHSTLAPVPCFSDEVTVLKELCETFKARTEYHFTLRCHPNIALNPGEQLDNLIKLKGDCPPNLTLIMPEEKIDTYELLKRADVAVASLSTTVGVEAVFLNKPSILLGPALYEDLDVAYKPQDMDEFIGLLKNKELPPKPQENALKYGYCLATYGEDFIYYKPTGLFEGTFMGVDLNKSHKFLPLLGKIKRFYYKQKASILKRLKPDNC